MYIAIENQLEGNRIMEASDFDSGLIHKWLSKCCAFPITPYASPKAREYLRRANYCHPLLLSRCLHITTSIFIEVGPDTSQLLEFIQVLQPR